MSKLVFRLARDCHGEGWAVGAASIVKQGSDPVDDAASKSGQPILTTSCPDWLRRGSRTFLQALMRLSCGPD